VLARRGHEKKLGVRESLVPKRETHQRKVMMSMRSPNQRRNGPFLRQLVNESDGPITRRGFLRATAAAAAAGVIGCDGKTPTQPGLDPDQTSEFVRAIIRGPGEIQIPAPWGVTTAIYDSKASTGGSMYRVWSIQKDQDPFHAPVQDLGDLVSVQPRLTRVGTYTLELRVYRPGGESSTTTQQITVLPPSVSEDYPRIGFFRHVWEGDSLNMVMYLMDPASGEATPFIGETGPSGLGGYRLSWEKGGVRLTTETAGKAIAVYDLYKDTLSVITGGGAPKTRKPSWNPEKEWIAFVDGGDAGRGNFMECAMVRPDGSEKMYLAGDSYRPAFAGNDPTWSPDGERLAMGFTAYENPENMGISRRISIYDDLWGEARRTQMPTQDQLLAFLDSRDANSAQSRAYIHPGLRGLAWSPDGEWLVYELYYAHQNHMYDFLAKSRVDGTGDIQVLVPGNDSAGFANPTWSPSGNRVLFCDLSGKIQSVSSGGGSVTTLTSGHQDVSPAWWG